MSPSPKSHAPRRATAHGTARYATRFADRFESGFYRTLGSTGLRVASIGLGTYLGECADADDERSAGTVMLALEGGINLIDTAINYRCQRAERTIGRVLAQAAAGGVATRDEVVLCTKGGYIPLDEAAPAERADYTRYLHREYFDRGLMQPEEVVAGGHCIAPAFLGDQIERSRRNLGVSEIDVYLVHNPEVQLDATTPDELERRLGAAFAMLEERCRAGVIGCYGVATWNAFRARPGERGYLSLQRLVALARDAGGEHHHFQVIQLPVNLAMTEAVREPTQPLGAGEFVSLLQAAADLGVAVITSGTLMQGKLTRGLPDEVREALPGHDTDAQRAIAFVRDLPVIVSALVGMKTPAFVDENLGAARTSGAR